MILEQQTDPLEQVENEVLQSYQMLIRALEQLKPNFKTEDSQFDKDSLGDEVSNCSKRVNSANKEIKAAYKSLEECQKKLVKIIDEIPDTLVTMPCGNINEMTYKQSLLENIKKNLEQLNK